MDVVRSKTRVLNFLFFPLKTLAVWAFFFVFETIWSESQRNACHQSRFTQVIF
jgi:hypothetical protein